ncbi:hypothetical protein [Flammeovirga aprica]|uniref:Uncharacterized protein n=1 Tax=Flammeovirga aprica JL-4 TaxID=694437 RepID=A0A7X9NZL8_9BACT|nr:hypothetical protein [Flammeovirga aprica]NME66605.1 hypothetical protein [Flammeovirga aprica JL-4]
MQRITPKSKIELRAMLPNGALTEIATKSNLTFSRVQGFFASKYKTSEREEAQILKATAELLEEIEQERKEAYKALASVLINLSN